ncbi:MAG: 16S rRNA (cytosine(1402)-N(4))-methyltransferase, partial [Actinomycetota bacterium]|nr:16S rRNA (cytosine(1402)-N(4))-methyltransferase [Actinomycetota bacterium]
MADHRDDDSRRGSIEFYHRPVMVEEILATLADIPGGVVLDATVGGGGHAEAILEFRVDLRIIGLD